MGKKLKIGRGVETDKNNNLGLINSHFLLITREMVKTKLNHHFYSLECRRAVKKCFLANFQSENLNFLVSLFCSS